jgi:hypothetical protein
VRKERLELSRVSPLDPKSSASTSSATFARAARTGRTGYALSAVRRGATIIADAARTPALLPAAAQATPLAPEVRIKIS